MKLTLRYLWEARESRQPFGISDDRYFEQGTGIVTLQYPRESIPVPDNGRYRLHNEIEDCIVCDKCAKICPVNCIDIEAIKAVEDLGQTSDGSVKRLHAARFDIDMSKCCFCGLCTTVCPTECLTMTPAYDFSVYDVNEHKYAFAEMTPLEILEKRQALEQQEQEKNKQKEEDIKKVKVSVKPMVRPQLIKTEEANEESAAKNTRPVFRPKLKPIAQNDENKEEIKPAVRPKEIPKKEEENPSTERPEEQKKQTFKPKIKPVIKHKPKNDD